MRMKRSRVVRRATNDLDWIENEPVLWVHKSIVCLTHLTALFGQSPTWKHAGYTFSWLYRLKESTRATTKLVHYQNHVAL